MSTLATRPVARVRPDRCRASRPMDASRTLDDAGPDHLGRHQHVDRRPADHLGRSDRSTRRVSRSSGAIRSSTPQGQQIIWGDQIYNPSGQQIIWGDQITTGGNQIIWGDSNPDESMIGACARSPRIDALRRRDRRRWARSLLGRRRTRRCRSTPHAREWDALSGPGAGGQPLPACASPASTRGSRSPTRSS